jgi:hypothetical protein
MFRPPELQRDLEEMRYSDDSDDRDLALQEFRRNGAIHDANWQWERLVREIRDLIYPPDLFPIHVQFDSKHPANGVASAALLFHCRTVEVGALVPDLKLEPQNLHYPPLEAHQLQQLYHAEGQKDYLLARLKELLSEEQVKDLERESWTAGVERFHQAMPHGLFVHDPSKWWWYLPLGANVSPEDLRKAAAELPAIYQEIYGDAPFDRLVHELLDSGKSQARIARLLGVSKDTVRRAKAARP